MGRLRITITQLILIIAYYGVGLAAIRSPTWIWVSALFSFSIATLAVATLSALYRLGERRAFWTGFALIGWLYLGLSWNPWSGSSMSPPIITSFVADLAYPTLVDNSKSGATTQGIWEYWSQPLRSAAPFNWAVPEPFRVICHSLLTPVVALLGGLLARRLHNTRDRAG